MPVEFENAETDKKEVFNVLKGTFSTEVAKDSIARNDKVNFALSIKDKFWLSDEAYITN